VTKLPVAVCTIAFGFLFAAPSATVAADSDLQTPSNAPASAVAQPAQEEDDAVLRLAEPEFRLVNLPTTLPLPRFKWSFDLAHRFSGNLADGSFADNAANLFGLDQGAIVGLELRFAPFRGAQAAAYRTTFDRVLQIHGRYDVARQGGGVPVGISALLSVEGADNMTERHAPALGASVSRTFGEWMAVYAVPIWVHNTAELVGTDSDTTFIGIGARLRVSQTVYLVGEVSPRVAGYEPGQPSFGFGIEKRVGGHLFQVNFTNSFGMTYAQVARGGFSDSLYLGFNLARKFY
jgi:hypothetical protein